MPNPETVEPTGQTISKHLRKGQLVVLESTSYPGTTEDVLRPILEESGLEAGKDFFLAYSPEREDPGNKAYSTRNLPKVVGGLDERSRDLGMALYRPVVDRIVPVSGIKVAEACKILENTYRAVNIALVNELKLVFDAMGIDVWEAIEAAKTKPFGFQPFYPGPGLGGLCIPIDPFYLTWAARRVGINTRFIELAGEVNDFRPDTFRRWANPTSVTLVRSTFRWRSWVRLPRWARPASVIAVPGMYRPRTLSADTSSLSRSSVRVREVTLTLSKGAPPPGSRPSRGSVHPKSEQQESTGPMAWEGWWRKASWRAARGNSLGPRPASSGSSLPTGSVVA
jgi:hypothetical protein